MGIMSQTPQQFCCFALHTLQHLSALQSKRCFDFFFFICTRIPFLASSRLPCSAVGVRDWRSRGLVPSLPPREVSPAPPAAAAGRAAPGAGAATATAAAGILRKPPRQTWEPKTKHLATKFIYGVPLPSHNGSICIGNKNRNSEIQQRAVCS